jgi:hypothetical protein
VTAHELEERRAFDCRLTPDRALNDVEEAAAFLAERGLLTRFPDCALPSLFGACHEAPGRAGGRGFDLWPKTKWIFSFQLTQQRGTVLTKLHRGKSLYLSLDAASAFDGLVRHAIDDVTGDEATLLNHLEQRGPSIPDDIELELRWTRQRLKRVRARLESVGAVISEGLVFEDSTTWHFAPLRRWDQVVASRSTAADPFVPVVIAGVKAAVLAPESDIQSWFSWRIPQTTVNTLVEEGRLVRPAAGLLALAD